MRVAAIVPAYNEHDRIGSVLSTLVASDCVAEIIVVDDGSESPLSIASQFPSVHFIRHEKNRGKGAALESAIDATSCEILFFCDADLVGFTPAHVKALVEPVTSGACDMTIGIRANPAQKAVFAFALNSGERCLPRADWTELPDFYKHGFRIEAGLNIRSWKKGKRVRVLNLSYYQTAREKKYGLIKGIRSRIHLSFDVALAWLVALLDNR